MWDSVHFVLRAASAISPGSIWYLHPCKELFEELDRHISLAHFNRTDNLKSSSAQLMDQGMIIKNLKVSIRSSNIPSLPYSHLTISLVDYPRILRVLPVIRSGRGFGKRFLTSSSHGDYVGVGCVALSNLGSLIYLKTHLIFWSADSMQFTIVH